MTSDAYSPHKAAHYRDELERFKAGQPLRVYPRQVQIDPFNPCNHDCPFCIYRYHRNNDINALFSTKDWIRLPKMLEIYDSCVDMGVKAVELTGGGEPTAHPQAGIMVEAALERGLEVGLVTNGASRIWVEELPLMSELAGQCAWVRFSLDAATEDTHNTVHRGKLGDFYNVLQSIAATVKKKKTDTIVGVSFVVTHENYHEILLAAQLADLIGVDNIRYSAAIFPDKDETYHAGHREKAMELLEAAKGLQSDTFTVFAFGERMRWQTHYGNYEAGDFCYYSTLNAVIGADLNLYPCCVLKYRPKGVVASLKDQTFQAAWESDTRKAYYDKLKIDTHCGTCYLKPKNDFIKYLATDNPVHVNFP